MKKSTKSVVIGVSGLVLLAVAACGSEDKGSDSSASDLTTGTPSTSATTSGSANTTTTVSSSATGTAGGVTGTGTTGIAASTGTTGASVTTGSTGFGASSSSGTGSTSSVAGTTGSATTGVDGVTSSTTGGEGEVFCDASLSGEDFYNRPQSCTHCHGEDALGTEDGPEARHPNADYLRWLIREGRMDHPDFPEGMPAVPEECLTDQMIEEIIVFLDSFPQPTTGAELYADYCANCHGSDGLGGVTGVSLDGELHENAGICVSGNETMSYGNRQVYMPGQGDKLSAAEIQLITDYLQNDLGLRF